MRLLAYLFALWLTIHPGQAEKVKRVADDVIEASQAAVITVRLDIQEANRFFRYQGVVITKDGLAVVPLRSIGYKTKPVIENAEGKEMGVAKVLAVDVHSGLGLVQLKSWDAKPISLAAKPAALREPAAVLWRQVDTQSIGIMHGPVLAYRSDWAKKLDHPPYMSLGTYFPKTNPPVVSAPVINAKGELIGVFSKSTLVLPGLPLQVRAVPLDDIRKLVARAESSPDGLPFPLKEGNPHDEAYWAMNLDPLGIHLGAAGSPPLPERFGVKDRDQAKIDLAVSMLKKFPDSQHAKKTLISAIGERTRNRFNVQYAKQMDDPTSDVDLSAVWSSLMDEMETSFKQHALAGEEVDQLKASLEILNLRMADDPEALLKRYEKDLAMWGNRPPVELLGLAIDAYERLGNHKKAGELLKLSIQLAPDNLLMLQQYESHLNKHYDAKEVARVSDLMWELEDWYSPR